jgi:hypothetical protein
MKLNRAARQMSLALAGEGLKDLAKAPAAPYLNTRIGSSAFQYVANPEEFIKTSKGQDFLKQYPDLDKLIDLAFAGGAKLTLHDDQRLHSMQAFRQAVAEKRALAALFHSLPALNQLLMTPLFEYYIPRAKFGAFLREFSEQLADNTSEIAQGYTSRAELARKSWDSVEDVFGQMNWDKFFWHNTFKAAIQLAFRAFTWFAGNVRLVGRGMTGQAREMFESLKYLNEQFNPNTKWRPSRPSTKAIPRLHPDMAKLLALTTTFVVGNAIIQKVMTGENPQDWKDLVAARVGGYDSEGKPNRVVMPAIVLKDLLSLWAHGPGSYLASKQSDLISGISDVLRNEDFRHVMVHDPNDPWWKQRMDDAAHIVGSPIGVENFASGKSEGEHLGERVLTAAGFSRAPVQLDMTPAERRMQEMIEQTVPVRTQAQVNAGRESHQRLLHSHTLAGFRARIEDSRPDLVREFEKLPYLQAREIYEKYANAGERVKLRPLLERKRYNLLRRDPKALRNDGR